MLGGHTPCHRRPERMADQRHDAERSPTYFLLHPIEVRPPRDAGPSTPASSAYDVLGGRLLLPVASRSMLNIDGAGTQPLGLDTLLIRPNGIVAWASAEALDTDTFVQSATRWLGRPNRRSIG
jgi:hypothetical protein